MAWETENLQDLFGEQEKKIHKGQEMQDRSARERGGGFLMSL